jgi:hypothetical protein
MKGPVAVEDDAEANLELGAGLADIRRQRLRRAAALVAALAVGVGAWAWYTRDLSECEQLVQRICRLEANMPVMSCGRMRVAVEYEAISEEECADFNGNLDLQRLAERLPEAANTLEEQREEHLRKVNSPGHALRTPYGK